MKRWLSGVAVMTVLAGCGQPPQETAQTPSAEQTADQRESSNQEMPNVPKTSSSGETAGQSGDAIVKPPKTPDEARQSLYEQAQRLGLLKDRPQEWWSRLAETGEKWHVEKQSYSKALERVDGTLREEEMNAIVFGTLDDLRKDGECWHVEDSQGSFAVIAYVDAVSGKLVFLWVPPEG